MHSPSCHGTFVVIRGCGLVASYGLQRTGFCRPPVTSHITLPPNSLRNFTF